MVFLIDIELTEKEKVLKIRFMLSFIFSYIAVLDKKKDFFIFIKHEIRSYIIIPFLEEVR